MEIGGTAAPTAPDRATPRPEVPASAAGPTSPPELADAARPGGAENVAPEVVVVGACDGPGRVTALVDALLAELRALAPEGAGRGVLGRLVAALGRVRAGADAAEARVVAAVERLGDGGVDAVEMLRRNAGSSQREARRRKRRAEVLAEMPNVTEALAAGDISAEHAEALARAAGVTSAEAVDGDAELLAQVAGVPADRAGRHIEVWTQRNQDPADLHEQLLRQRRRRRLNFGDGDDGMLMAHAAFDRVLGAQFRSLINGIADRIWRAEGGRDNPDSRSPEQRRLDALAIAVGLESEPSVAAAREPAAQPRPQPGDDPAPLAPLEPGPQPAEEPVPVTPREPRPQPGDEPAPLAPRAPGSQPAEEPVPVTPREPRPQPGDEPAPATPREPGPQPATGPLVVPPRHQVVIVASTDVISGKDPQGRCEIPGVGPIPLSELERLACDAELFGLLFSGEGEPLWHGRGERTATDAQRRALIARDGVCVLCAEEPSRCESHHVVAWAKPAEGPTDIDNLALLCGTCHRRLHNNRRILTRSPDGAWGTAPDPRYTGRATGNVPDPHAANAPAPRQAARNPRSRRTVACAVHTGEITRTLDLERGLGPTGGLNAAGAAPRTSRPETAGPIGGLAGVLSGCPEARVSDLPQPTSSGRDPPRQPRWAGRRRPAGEVPAGQ